MDLKELYKKDTGYEWDCVGYPKVGYADWLEDRINNGDLLDVRLSSFQEVLDKWFRFSNAEDIKLFKWLITEIDEAKRVAKHKNQ